MPRNGSYWHHHHHLSPRNLNRCAPGVEEEEEEFEFQFPGNVYLDVMDLIFNRLNDLITRIRFSAVCRSWRWVAQCSLIRHPQFPWLTLDNATTYRNGLPIISYHHKFLSLSEDAIYLMHLPPGECCGSHDGWLVMQRATMDIYGGQLKDVFIINPLSRVKIQLPTMTVPYLLGGVEPQFVPMRRIRKAILSSTPSSSSNECLVAAIDLCGGLHLCRLSDRSWTQQHCNKHKPFIYRDIVFYDGSLYGTNGYLTELMVLEFDPHLKFKARKLHVPIPEKFYGLNCMSRRSYLAVCGGKLFGVFFAIDPAYGAAVGLHVCKLDSWKWVEVESFDGEEGMLFLSEKNYIYLKSPLNNNNYPSPALNYSKGSKGNYICFTDQSRFPPSVKVVVFSLQDKRLEGCFTTDSFDLFSHVWYTPILHY